MGEGDGRVSSEGGLRCRVAGGREKEGSASAHREAVELLERVRGVEWSR